MRDWLIPPLAYGLLFYLKTPSIWWQWLLIFPAILLTGFALTTYWDFLFNNKDNFYMHGAMVGLGAFPMIWAGVHWYMVLIRLIILAVFMGQLNYWVNKKAIPFRDWIEELGRGLIIIATIPLLIL
jgi:hypothetical protein